MDDPTISQDSQSLYPNLSQVQHPTDFTEHQVLKTAEKNNEELKSFLSICHTDHHNGYSMMEYLWMIAITVVLTYLAVTYVDNQTPIGHGFRCAWVAFSVGFPMLLMLIIHGRIYRDRCHKARSRFQKVGIDDESLQAEMFHELKQLYGSGAQSMRDLSKAIEAAIQLTTFRLNELQAIRQTNSRNLSRTTVVSFHRVDA
ncbi:MAG: hypothetical protein LQ342_008114 [Letrouitia transgressa]|nr:MAG: hypothetical protein LQ342_008114 [Letrouitia transgressa]